MGFKFLSGLLSIPSPSFMYVFSFVFPDFSISVVVLFNCQSQDVKHLEYVATMLLVINVK